MSHKTSCTIAKLNNLSQDTNYSIAELFGCISIASGDRDQTIIQLKIAYYFWRRRNWMAKPLLKHGIGAIILENPYYGLRKPKKQLRSSLRYVSDIFVMGGCLILECIVLLNWCEYFGLGPLGVSGLSMGGHMASLAASNWPKPLVLVPCLSWSTASSVFTEGVMSDSINWDMLQNQYFSDELYNQNLSKLCKIVDSPLACSLNGISENESSQTINTHHISPYDILRLLNVKNSETIGYSSNNLKSKLAKEYSTIINFSNENNMSNQKKRNKESVWFMRGIMDEFTHLKNFSVPYDTSLIIAVCAKSDGYVPRVGTSKLEDVWPGSTVKYVDTGHVGAFIWYRKLIRECIIEAFEKAKNTVKPLL